MDFNLQNILILITNQVKGGYNKAFLNIYKYPGLYIGLFNLSPNGGIEK